MQRFAILWTNCFNLRISQDICYVRITDNKDAQTIYGHHAILLNNNDCYHHYHKRFLNADIITHLSDLPYFTIQTNKGQRQFQVLRAKHFFLFLPILKWRT